MGALAARQFTDNAVLLVRAHVAFEDLGGDGNVVVAVVDSLDLLIPLGALARNDDGVTGLGREDCPRHRVGRS